MNNHRTRNQAAYEGGNLVCHLISYKYGRADALFENRICHLLSDKLGLESGGGLEPSTRAGGSRREGGR